MRIEGPPDPDWYLDHVVVPGGMERRPAGPVRARQAWPEYKLVLEADGLSKCRTGGSAAEKRRERALVRAGYRVERVIWSDVIDAWPATAVALSGYLPRTR